MPNKINFIYLSYKLTNNLQMAPKKFKQTARNAFYYFMLEFKTKTGRKYNSMREVADAADPHWSRMSKEQKKPLKKKL